MEGPWILVVDSDVVVNGFDQVAHAAEYSTADSLARDFGKPALDLVKA
jgi:hypothetical protein